MSDRLYRAAVIAALPLVHAASRWNERLRRGVDGRRASLASLEEWSAQQRDRTRPLVWLHAPSVGEALMAQAVLHELRALRPDIQALFTFFSPSAERMAARVGADWHGYLPWDTPRLVQRALDAADPDAIAFVRTEIWPELVRQAAVRGAGVVMVNGVLAAGSSRSRGAARALLSSAYGKLHAVGAVSDDDAARFPLLGVARERIRVTGDARFDQVWQRVHDAPSLPLLDALRTSARPWLVAGSTWEADETLLVDALEDDAGWRIIVAPHEPTASHLKRLEEALDAARMTHARLPSNDEREIPDARVLVVDRVGVLADLYRVGAAAYVGGGFGTSGLHSVVEPAALGVPVLYGPKHGNAQEAKRLAAAGGGVVVQDASQLRARLDAWRADDGERQRAADAARAFVERHRGGAANGAAVILDHLRRR